MRQRALRILLVGAPLALLLLLAGAPGASAQQILPCDMGEPGDYSRVSRAPAFGFRSSEVVQLESERDGVTIELGLVRPDVPEGTRVPVIAVASPYFHPLSTLDLRACRPELTENFVSQGYAVALIAVRGTADSGGCMDLFGPAERADLDQAVTWLGTRPWSTGAVGMVGLSYDGGTPWEVAAAGNPHLRTIVPISGVPDVFELLFGGGVPDYRGPGILNGIYDLESVLFYLPGRSVEHTVEVTACPDYATGVAAAIESTLTGKHDGLGYWEQRRFRDRIEERYRGSVLLVQGLQDWNVNPGLQYPWVGRLEERGVFVKHLLGQWGHNTPDGPEPPARRGDWADLLLRWFDRWLYGRTDVDLGPRAEVQDSAERWRAEETWPPEGTKRAFWLEPNRLLAPAPGATGATVMLGPDPVRLRIGDNAVDLPEPLGSLCEQPLCAAFETGALADELHLAGLPRLNLRVAPLGASGQLSAYLYAVAGEEAQRLGWGQVDLRFPRGGDSSGEVRAGEPIDVELTLQPLDAVAPAGSRLLLALSQGTAYDRLPPPPSLPLQVEVGRGSGSLTLTEIATAPDDFFDPPD